MHPFGSAEPYDETIEHKRLIELARTCANQTRACVGVTKELIETTRQLLATLQTRVGPWPNLRYPMGAKGAGPLATAEQAQFLLADARSGLTFLDLASATRDVSAQALNLKNAEQALSAVTYHATRVTLTASDTRALDELVRELVTGIEKARLRTAGGL